MYALVVTVLTFIGSGGATSVQHVDWYTSADGCEAGRKAMIATVRKEQPAAQLVIGCVPVQRKVVS